MLSEERLPSPGRPFGRIGWVFCLVLVLYQGVGYLLSLLAALWMPGYADTASAALIIQVICLYLLALPAARLLLPDRTVTLPPKKRPLPPLLAVRLFLVALAMLFTVALATAAALFWLAPDLINPISALAVPDSMPVLILIGVVLAPIGEELLFRGVLLRALGDYGDGMCIFLSGVMFGLFHLNLYQIFYAAVLGAFFAWLVRRTGLLRCAVIFHILINLLGLVALPRVSRQTDPTVLMAFGLVLVAVIIFGFVQFAFRAAYLSFEPGPLPLSFGRKLLLAVTRPGMLVYLVLCIALTAAIILGPPFLPELRFQ
ncbi:MAG: CPBP family intramembrane metalloprotease [Oscillospiraceae bacterium]|nr:CPBP family intramembrane metalloprotease [Oscillospiraceae bacterium]